MSEDLAEQVVRKILDNQRTRLAMQPGEPAEDYYMGKVAAGLEILRLIPGGLEMLVRAMARGSPRADDVMPA